MRQLWSCFFLSVTLIAVSSLVYPLICVAQSVTSDQVSSDQKNLFLGLHIHRAAKSPWPDFKFGAWRLWDAGVSWRDIQPQKGQFDFVRLDNWVRLAEKNGVELTYVFGVPPIWASSRPNEDGAYGPGSAAEPASLNDWRQYVRAVVSRYRGRIKNYEIWNEPNWKNFYTGSWAQLATLVHEAALVVREVDPGARIVLPGLASEQGLSVMDEFLRTGVGRDVDVIGYHFYTGNRAPEVLFDMVNKLRSSLRTAGLEKKPVWNTEFGWLIEGRGRVINPSAVGFSSKAPVYKEEVAASFIVRAYTILAGLGIERSYYYAWDNESMGIFDPITRQLKPVLNAAFHAIGRWLGGSTPQCGKGDGFYLCQLGNSGTAGALVWSDRAALSSMALKKDWRLIEDINGKVLDLNGTLPVDTLGVGPYLLRK